MIYSEEFLDIYPSSGQLTTVHSVVIDFQKPTTVKVIKYEG